MREDTTVLCFAGHGISRKGIAAAGHITPSLNVRGYPVDLVIFGDGPGADDVRRNKPHNVYLHENINVPGDYYGCIDIGILPTKFAGESIPLATIEMMECDIPIVASEIGDMLDMLGE